jgi:hypothetical protein
MRIVRRIKRRCPSLDDRLFEVRASGITEHIFDQGRSRWSIAKTKNDYTTLNAAGIWSQDCGNPCGRKVTGLARELSERPALTWHWFGELNRRHQLVGFERRRERSLEELVSRYGPLTLGGSGDHDCLECDRYRRQFGLWVVVRQAAAHGAAIADLGMTDLLDGCHEHRPAVVHVGMVGHLGLGHGCSDPKVRRELERTEFVDPADVYN